MSRKKKYLYCMGVVIIVCALFYVYVYRNKKTDTGSINAKETQINQMENSGKESIGKAGEKMKQTEENLLEGIEKVSEADLYEFTKNNFQEGLSYQLQAEELEKLKNIIIQQEYQLKKAKLQKDTEHYILNLYDKAGKKIEAFTIDTKGNIFIDKETEIESEGLKRLLDQLLENS